MKREIFSELVEGFDALANERQGKVTLRTHKVHLNNLEPLTADQLTAPLQREALALVAATVQPVRLIDNMILPAAAA